MSIRNHRVAIWTPEGFKLTSAGKEFCGKMAARAYLREFDPELPEIVFEQENKSAPGKTDVRLEIFQRGLYIQRYPVRIPGKKVFVGQARNWKESSDPNFLKVLEEGKISPDNEIAVFDQGEGENGEKKYCITLAPAYHF